MMTDGTQGNEIKYVKSLYSDGDRWQEKAVWALHRLSGERKRE